jgi:uncharacterized SAM-binding protein YcdF (DUF218 family)
MRSPVQLIEFLTSPVGLVTIFFAAGFSFFPFKKLRRLGKKLLIASAGLIFIYVFSPISEILVWNLEKQYPSSPRIDSKTRVDRIVVLAGYAVESKSQIPVAEVSEETLRRISEGIRIYRQLPGAKLVIPGAPVNRGDRPISEIMASVMQELGVSKDDIIVETRSINTRTNLAHVNMLIGASPFILVTSACDLPRAMGVARKLKMNAIPAPAGAWTLREYRVSMNFREWIKAIAAGFANPSYERLGRLQWAYHEYVGIAWYRFRGWI